MANIKKQIEELTEQAEALAEVREDVVVMNQEITTKVMVALFEKLSEAIDELMEGVAVSASGKNFGAVLKNALSETVTQIFASYKPGDFKPTINVDLKPIQQTFADIASQNAAIEKLLNVLLVGDGGKADELHRLITAMVEKQNTFLEKSMKQYDYTKELKLIGEGVNKKDERIERLDVKRDRADNLITSVIPVYKNAENK